MTDLHADRALNLFAENAAMQGVFLNSTHLLEKIIYMLYNLLILL